MGRVRNTLDVSARTSPSDARNTRTVTWRERGSFVLQTETFL